MNTSTAARSPSFIGWERTVVTRPISSPTRNRTASSSSSSSNSSSIRRKQQQESSTRQNNSNTTTTTSSIAVVVEKNLSNLIVTPEPKVKKKSTLVVDIEQHLKPTVLFAENEIQFDESVVQNNEIEWERKHLLLTLQENLIDWDFILQRIYDYPEIVQPVQWQPLTKVVFNTTSTTVELYEQTILGELCRMNMTKINNIVEEEKFIKVFHTVLNICPWQVRCSQRIYGHTPVRDAVCNITFTNMDLLTLLIQTDVNIAINNNDTISSVLHILDRDNLSPLDHLLHSIQILSQQQKQQQGMSDNNNNNISVTKLSALLQYARRTVSTSSSPYLLQLLSLGTSGKEKNIGRLNAVCDSCRLLLQWDTSLIHRKSQVTGCSPIHVAIRNYGDHIPLIEELIQWDHDECKNNGTSLSCLVHRNHFGDLPLHVACSVGVPMKILRLILSETIIKLENNNNNNNDNNHSDNNDKTTIRNRNKPNPLIWSTNHAGYTPVDLEWIRHLEGGRGFFAHRTFYPLDARGVPRLGGRYRDVYDDLLRQAVDQVLGQSSQTMMNLNRDEGSTTSSSSVDSDDECESSFGRLLHRIFLIIQASSDWSFSGNNGTAELTKNILHRASILCGPNKPTIPRPILELILWQQPEQVERQDESGRLPLHYAVEMRGEIDEHYTSIKLNQEWKLWVQKLLCHAPEACSVKDCFGRLPLHYALVDPNSDASTEAVTPYHEARNIIVKDLANRNPVSVEAKDPIVDLYPFQLAASNRLLSLETVFFLLRRSPGVISL